MSLFLMVFLANLLAFGVFSLIFIGCLIFAVWEYKKKQAQKTQDFLEEITKFDKGDCF